MNDILRQLDPGGCREWMGSEPNHFGQRFNNCYAPAEFVIWGKLFPREALGPRCYDHAAKHIGHDALIPNSGYAVMDLRPLRRALDDDA